MSLRWELVGSEPQLFWGAYNDPLTIFGQYIIVANKTFCDPQKQIYVFWDGNITSEGRIHLILRSEKALAVKFTNYTGKVSPFGHPLAKYKLKVAAIEGQDYLVYLDGSPKWGFQFGIEEKGIPLLKVYDGRGELQTTYWITSLNKPYEYGGVEGLGFIVEKVLLNKTRTVITWIYAGKEITIKPIKEWGSLKRGFPFLTASPDKAEPGMPIEIILKLPKDAKDFTTNLYDFPVSTPIKTYDPLKDEYHIKFSFKPEAQGKRFTVWFRARVGESTYEDQIQILCLPYSYMQYLLPASILILIFVIVGLIALVIKMRREPLHPEQALRLSEEWR